jgi:ribulose-5-phosphate 4-epimerase/fuculose-1-phosphate aldolase
LFAPTLPRFVQTTDLIVTPALGQAVAETLAGHSALLLKNHGIVVVGRSVEEACITAIVLEKAAACSCSPGNTATSGPQRRKRCSGAYLPGASVS